MQRKVNFHACRCTFTLKGVRNVWLGKCQGLQHWQNLVCTLFNLPSDQVSSSDLGSHLFAMHHVHFFQWFPAKVGIKNDGRKWFFHVPPWEAQLMPTMQGWEGTDHPSSFFTQSTTIDMFLNIQMPQCWNKTLLSKCGERPEAGPLSPSGNPASMTNHWWFRGRFVEVFIRTGKMGEQWMLWGPRH